MSKNFDPLAILAARYPRTFFLAGRDRRPLKVGISNDLLVAKTDLSNTELRRALASYTSSIGYLSKMLEGATRIDLDGAPAGVVTLEQSRHAQARAEALVAGRNAATEARRNAWKARPRAPVAQAPAPPRPLPSARPAAAPLGPKRLGLADLKQAWLARQAKAS